ncbi:guanine nucleotide exchange factor for Rab-3A-like isoform X1 [Penaeus japonicus]|uniref:guanine nucleotide exchange factor for Rab-3A-like isoform X1 n=1 Tax=Penaeus japonicus TaxID=27405 RepID=UPI001C716815|nr:guanine nucleotide exchange factor for Rab-3A-like isoform X1 [Penaeus japonicus]XP_042877582.1 guanine nucleotide exchange factor for Rab-3A-like isoform X1 [Penaeus japonicus]
MSVAVSAGMGESCQLQQEKDDKELEEWRQEVRAKVTALKCHVMASRGLTPEGTIVPPYSPRILLEAPPNARLLLDADTLDLDAYTESLQNGSKGSCTKDETEYNTEEEEVLPQEPLSLDDVHVRLKEMRVSSSDGQKASVSNPSPSKSVHSLNNKSQPSTPSHSTYSSSPQSPSTSSPTTLSPSKQSSANASDVNSLAENDYSQVNGVAAPKVENVEEELNKVKGELKHKVEEVERLSRIRDEVENELQELTANLFQEAHSMVHNANQRAASAERSLREAMMQVEVLQAEVTALKALVITSTPAAPNPHLHPQLISKSITETGKKIFQRGHRKSPSDFDLKYGRDTTPPSSPLKESRINDAATSHPQFPLDPECWEVDPVVHKEFIMWKQNPVLDQSDPFIRRIYAEDIDLCMAFPNSTLAHRVQRAIEDNDVFIEEVNPRQKSSCPKVDPDDTRKCVLLDVPRFCKYRFRLGESDDTWYYISQLARNRIIAICDFLNYLRYIKLGLVKSSIHDMYWEIVKLRRQMALARLGF